MNVKRLLTTITTGIIFGIPGLLVVTSVLAAAPQVDTTWEDSLIQSVTRGGRLYENWIVERYRKPFAQAHSAYPKESSFVGDIQQTWLCMECHGWDYKGKDGVFGSGKHYTGIKGINGMDGSETNAIITVLKNDLHGFEAIGVFYEEDYVDLANFIAKGQIDMDSYIDRETGVAKGNKDRNQAYYQTICSMCHGNDGTKVDYIPPLGSTSNSRPWRALHGMINGHPKDDMPAMRIFGIDVLTDILTYIQSFQSEYLYSSIVRGGRLYNSWYTEIGVKPPSRRHPSYPTKGKLRNTSRATWRCQECHGWDYLGKDGAFAKGEHATGIKGIRAMDGVEPSVIVALLKDERHQYGNLLSEHDLYDLALFVSKGQVDMHAFVDPETGEAKGDKVRQKSLYTTICSSCHSLDGMGVSLKAPSLGDFARKAPWQTLHGILNGHPDEEMPPLRILDQQTIMDVMTYIQQLPPGK